MSPVSLMLSSGRPAQGERAIAGRRAALFLVICSPLWLAPRALWQGYPFTLPALIGVTLLFVRWDRRSATTMASWICRGAEPEFVCGLGGGALLFCRHRVRHRAGYAISPGSTIHGSIRRWRCFRSFPCCTATSSKRSLVFGLVFVRWRSVPAAAGGHVAANWMRDLTLQDPPGPATLFGPLAPRPWTTSEQVAVALVWNGGILLACVYLWGSIHRRLDV